MEELFFISEQEAGERLDKILAARFAKVASRTYFHYLIEENKVLLNGAPVKKRIKPKEGDEVEIEFLLTPELTISPENIPMDIIYEDEAILAVNKPPGMVIHPAPGNWSSTFVNALLFHCQNLPGPPLRPGIVHRLDKDTSGVLIAAKTALAQQRLIEMFANRQIYKEYLAICLGNPGNCEIKTLIGRHPVNRKLMTVLEKGGREAITTCKTLSFDGKLSLVQAVIATGRTHQIRVHMKHRGTPILGDDLYGNHQANQKYGTERQMLHARLLRFKHPISRNDIELSAEIPYDMKTIIEKL